MQRRARTPTIIQMEAIESGAAALGMILGYYGYFATLEQLRVACGVSRDGSLAANILEAARHYGLEAHEHSLSSEVLKTIPTPFIINWHYPHQYVVVEEITEKKIYVNDPAVGPRAITWDELTSHYTGKAFTFKPTPSFRKAGKPQPFLKTIAKRFKGCLAPMSYLILASLILLIPGIALPTFIQLFVDTILVHHLTATAPVFITGLLSATLLAGLVTALQGYYLARLNGKLSIRLSSQFLWHILRLPIEFYVQRYGGEIGYRLLVNDNLVTTLTEDLALAWINLLLIVVYGVLMFFYDAAIAWIGIGAALINLLVMFWLWRARSDANIRLQQDIGKKAGIAIGGLQNIESLKAVAAESDFFARWAGYLSKTINTMQEIGKFDIYLTILPPFTQFLAAAAVLTIGGTRVIEGKMTLGMLLGLLTLMYIFLRPISKFVYLGQKIQNVKGGLNRIDDVLSNPTDPALDQYATEVQGEGKLKGELLMRNVTFGYNTLGPPLIENFNLHIQPGKSVALVGPSGCGKSTIGRLITGLYQPWTGEVLFDDKPRSKISRIVLNRSLAAVDQQIFLFGAPVRDNLTLWDAALPEEDMVQGAVDACIHSEIIQRSHAYDSEVIEGGLNFSGGQRQLLEIARALAINPTFLLLDEATSALDSETEEHIIHKIKERGCAYLVISHRLSTIRDCDEIIVLEKGKVTHRGDHETLKTTSPLYQALVRGEGALA